MKLNEIASKLSSLPKAQRISIYVFMGLFVTYSVFTLGSFLTGEDEVEPEAPSMTLNEKLEIPLAVEKKDLPPSEEIEGMLSERPDVNLNDFTNLNPMLIPSEQGDPAYSISTGEGVSQQGDTDIKTRRGKIEEVKFEKEIKFFIDVYDDDILGMVVVQNSNNNKNLLLRLTDAKTGELSAQVHVPANDLARAMVPIGIYTAQVEQGFAWYGDKYGFAKKSTVDDLDVTVVVEPTSKGNEAYLEFSTTASSSAPKSSSFFSDLAAPR